MANIKGAKRGQEKARKPSIAKDSASSVSTTKILYGLSEGEVVGLADGAKSIILDGTPLIDSDGNSNFEGITWDFREGTNYQDYIKGFPDVSNETPINLELKSSTPFIRAINNTQLSAIRVRFRWDRLLQTNDENGDVTGYKIEYAIDLKTDSLPYSEVLNTKIEDKTSAGYERTHRIDLPRATGGWQIRIRRITPNSNSEYVQDKMYIDALAEVIDVKLSYPNTSLLGLQYNAETFSRIAKLEVDLIGKIIQVPSNYDTINKKYNGLWDGTFKESYSNNPAWIYYDLVTQWRYGIGEKIDADMIDKWSIYQLAQYCDEKVSNGEGGFEPRFECNVYLQTQEDAYTVLNHLSGIFTAMSFWNGEKIILDADIPKDPVYTFSAANVVDGNFEYTGTRQRDRHTIAKIAWDNPSNGYQTEYEYIRDEEAIAKYGVNMLDLSAFGCTSQAQAQRLGLRALKAEQLETRQVAFSVGLDGFIPQVGNIINISDELLTGVPVSGRISAVSEAGYVVTLDRTSNAKTGDTLIVNNADGVVEKKMVRSVNGEKVTVTSPFVKAQSESLWALESAELPLMRFRIMQINQNDDATFNIVALQHDPSKYAGIDNGTDVKNTHNTGNQVLQPTDKINAPREVAISARYRIEQGLSVTTAVIQWSQVSNAVRYIVQIKKDSQSWQLLPETTSNYTELDNVFEGSYTARVKAVSPFGVESSYTESSETFISKKDGAPTAPLTLTAFGILFGMQLNWQFGEGSENTAFTEIQQATDKNNPASISQQGLYAYPTDNVTIQGLGAYEWVFYRARLIDKFGGEGEWTEWVEAQTDGDPQSILDILEGMIEDSLLTQALREQIATIPVTALALANEILEREQSGAAIQSSVDTLSSETIAIASQVDTMVAKVDNNAAAIQTTNETIVSKDTAMGRRVDTVQSQVNDPVTGLAATTALVRSETQARTSQYNSIASQTSTLQTTLNGNITKVQQHTSSIDGLMGQWTLRVDNNNRVSGFGLASNNNRSDFAINADAFWIMSPQDTAGKGGKPFTYLTNPYTDPETGTRIPAGLYVEDATIKNASIGTLKVAGQAITATSSAPISNSNTSRTVYIASGGGMVQFRVTAYGITADGSGNYEYLSCILYKNGVEMTRYATSHRSGWNSFTETFEWVGAGGMGTDSFHAVFTNGGGSLIIRQITVTAMSVKR